MIGAIARIDRWLAAHHPDYYVRLRPGATDEVLDAFERRFSLRLPPAFRALYRWRDGQHPECCDSLHQNRMFVPLEDVTDTKDLLDGMIGYDFEDPRYWRRDWVPFLHNGSGSYLCLDLAAEGGGVAGQLVAFWKSDKDRPVEHASMGVWLTTVADSMEAGTCKSG